MYCIGHQLDVCEIFLEELNASLKYVFENMGRGEHVVMANVEFFPRKSGKKYYVLMEDGIISGMRIYLLMNFGILCMVFLLIRLKCCAGL